MKLEKWYEKMLKLVKKESRIPKICLYENKKTNMMFFIVRNGGLLYNINNKYIKKIPKAQTIKVTFELFNIKKYNPVGQISKKIIKIDNCKKKLLKLENKNTIVYTQPKFFKDFPKNTIFDIFAPNKPIIASIVENGVKNIIAVIFPVYFNSFTEFEEFDIEE